MKKNLKKESARQIVTTWAKETNIAGLNNASRAKSKLRFLYWIIIFAFFSLMTVNSLVSVITDYIKYPVVTSIDLSHKPQVDFPAVTICNMNRSVGESLIVL